jgi:D-methionine transport system ATP-binding protein
VVVDGVDLGTLPEAQLRAARRAIGLVFQHVNLLDSRTVAANVAYPLQIAGVRRRERDRRARELLDLVGLADRGDAYPAELSGGQRQRVGIARALATEPAVLLCDEPTSALDSDTTRALLETLREINRKLGVTIVIVTHELSVVEVLCRQVAILESGRLVEQFAVDDAPLAPRLTSLGREIDALVRRRERDAREAREASAASAATEGEAVHA